jgi:hypothetical protein
MEHCVGSFSALALLPVPRARRELGTQLQTLRTESGLSVEQVAEQLEPVPAKVIR